MDWRIKMPNWCNNIAYIKFPSQETYDSFIAAYEEQGNDFRLFSYFIPRPAFLENISRLDDNHKEDWHSWSKENWSTKWDAVLHDMIPAQLLCKKDGDLTIRAEFDTAWCPPDAFYTTLCERWGFDIEAYYVEYGMDYGGIWTKEKDTLYDGLSNREYCDRLDSEFDVTATLDEFEAA